jgi:hypothetical protein
MQVPKFERLLVVFAQNIAHPHNGFNLFRAEAGQQIPPNRLGMNRPRSVQLRAAMFGKHHENDALAGITTLDELSLLHPREVVRKAALVPPHRLGQRLLAHLTFAESGETRQNSKVGTGKASPLRDVAPHPFHHVFAHKFEGMPDTKLMRG